MKQLAIALMSAFLLILLIQGPVYSKDTMDDKQIRDAITLRETVAFDSLNENSIGAIFLTISNQSDRKIHLKSITANKPDYIKTIDIIPEVSEKVIDSYSEASIKIMLTTSENVDKNDRLLLLTATIQYDDSEIVKEMLIDLKTAGKMEEELGNLFGVPVFLILPGIIFVTSLRFFTEDKLVWLKKLTDYKSPFFLVFAVTISIIGNMMIQALKISTFGLTNIVFIWMLYLMAGIFLAALILALQELNQWWFVYKEDEEPLKILKKIKRNKGGFVCQKYTMNEYSYGLLPYRKRKGKVVYLCGEIVVEYTDSADITQQITLAIEKNSVKELLELVDKHKIQLNWKDNAVRVEKKTDEFIKVAHEISLVTR